MEAGGTKRHGRLSREMNPLNRDSFRAASFFSYSHFPLKPLYVMDKKITNSYSIYKTAYMRNIGMRSVAKSY